MLRIRNIMTAHVHSMSPDFSIRDAMEFLTAKRISGAPIVENGQILGVVTVTDLIAFASSLPRHRDEPLDVEEWAADEEPEADDEDDDSAYFRDMLGDEGEDADVRFREAEHPDGSRLDDVAVAEVMTDKLHTLPSTTEISQAADYMRRAGIHRVLVVDDGKLSGIVTVSDIAGAVADHRVAARTYVFGHEL